ncbi:peptide deformylase [Roseobacteraceae bacterium S113]
MALREILLWPDPRLGEVCPAVETVDLTLIGDMFETMYAAPGRGLAAPQIGVMTRIFVMDVTWKEGEMSPLVCINPEIVAHSDEASTNEEACLSIPGVSAEVTRPARITLRYEDVHGESHETEMDGFAAICAQHELDHLDGKVIFDRLPDPAAARLRNDYA